ncbi:uncharacterized protein LOC104583885 isoform X2 [Brachypodium distachyon]|uniref:uncharacterized protein LOC104583885 isoform X2 n=1 Tax=Brachypodium distachyon TaxID=15368 RepID=UPI0005300A47|nr:uncharacterized protein LOC104583885 isoform X2 [Brachypodium distachyon]|eukprot:XP_010236181.1 uncharacterized protein LOC104583885 isoform X2 [Brachypodium distachyon]
MASQPPPSPPPSMAAAGDAAPAGLFSGVWSRLHAAASSWRHRRGEATGDGGNEGEEAVRSRLVRRAAAARRVGRKLAFVSFNLEVLVFVYAFWRARRRSLSWRQPIQALPMLVIPALATLIYAAFVRFTRMLDLKYKKRLERLQEEQQKIDSEPREFDQNNQRNIQNCDDMNDATNSLVATDFMAQTPKLSKQCQSSINLRDDVQADMAWGHSKDFQPMPSDGLRQRRFSSGKTYTTNSSAIESSEERTQKTPSVSAHSNQHVHVGDNHRSRSAISSMLAEPANIPHELPAGDGEEEGFGGLCDTVDTRSSPSKENPTSPVGSHSSFRDSDDSRLSEHGISSLPPVELYKVSEEHSLSLPENLEFSTVFIDEAPASPPEYFVAHSILNALSLNPSDVVLSTSGTSEKLLAEGVKEESLLESYKLAPLHTYPLTSENIPTPCSVVDSGVIISSDEETYPLPSVCRNIRSSAAIVNIDTVSPTLNLLPGLLDQGIEDLESSGFHVAEENMMPSNFVEEVSICPHAVKNIEHCLETPEFSLSSHGTEKMEVAENVRELAEEGGEDAREKEMCELYTEKENDTLVNLEDEAPQSEHVASTTDKWLETSEFSLCSQDAKMTEVLGIVSSVTVSPELNYPAFPELLAEGDEDSKEDETSDLHLNEQKGLPFNLENEPFLDTLVVDAAEDSLVSPEFLLCSEEVKMAELHEVSEEVLSESEDEGAFNHQKLVVVSPDDSSNTENLVSNSMSAQCVPDVNVKEVLQGDQEALSALPHESTCHSEEIFLSSGEINNDKVEVQSPSGGQGGLPKSEDEMAFTSLDIPNLLDEVISTEILPDNSGSSECIPDSYGIQSPRDREHAPSETLQEVLLDGSLASSDEGINSEIFSLYSRSSSCVSDVKIPEILRGGTSSEPENDLDFSFDERHPVIFPNMDCTENYANNPRTAVILEANMIETLNVAEEATAGSLHEVSSNFLGTLVAPDVSNGTRQSDKQLDLLSSSFAPIVDAFEPLQTGQGFSEMQCENDFTFQETKMSPKEVNNAENYLANTSDDDQDGNKTSTVALQTAEPRLSESQYEDIFTLPRTYMSPDDINDTQTYLSNDYASDLPQKVESHCPSEKESPQDPLSFEEILVLPDGVSQAANDLGSVKSPSCSKEVNLAAPLGIDQEETQQQDETILRVEDVYASENHFSSSESVDVPETILAETLQGADRLSSEILYDGIFSFEGTSISLDGDNNVEKISNNSGSAVHTAQINTTSLLGLQEGSLKPESVSASSCNDISIMEAPQELPTNAGSEKVFSKDKEPKEAEPEEMKEDLEDLDGDHVVSRTPSDVALNLYLLY